MPSVDHVGEQVVQIVLGDRLSARLPAFACRPCLHPPPAAVEFFHHRDQRAQLEVERENLPHALRLFLIHHQGAALRGNIIAKDGIAAHPLSFAPRGGHLVVRALRDHLPLELGKREQDIQRQPAEGSGRIELLGYRHKCRVVLVEDLDDPGEVQ